MKNVKRIFAILTAAALFFALSLSAWASVPSRPENYYVLDSAGVLSESAEQEIISQNEKLFNDTGAEIVVVCVDFLGGQKIEDYAYDLFNSWGIGSAERNNGLLLVLAIGEENYYALSGYGIESHFTGSKLGSMVDKYLEKDFAAENYEEGVMKFFNAAYTELSEYRYNDEYDVSSETFDIGSAFENFGNQYNSSNFLTKLISLIIRVVFAIVVVFVIITIIRAVTRSGRSRNNTYNNGTYNNYGNYSTYSSGRNNSGSFWKGMLLGSMLGRNRRRYNQPPRTGSYNGPPPPGFNNRPNTPPRSGGYGTPHGSSFSRPSSSGRSSFTRSSGGSRPSAGSRPSSRPSGGSRSGGFSRGGGSRGGGGHR